MSTSKYKEAFMTIERDKGATFNPDYITPRERKTIQRQRVHQYPTMTILDKEMLEHHVMKSHPRHEDHVNITKNISKWIVKPLQLTYHDNGSVIIALPMEGKPQVVDDNFH